MGSLPRLLNAIKIIRAEDASESRTSSSGYLLPMMTSLWRFNLPREPLWQALDLFSRPPDGLPECSERLQTAVHMAISLTDASGPMLSVLRVTAGDHGRRSPRGSH